jgi:hypothetical protein
MLLMLRPSLSLDLDLLLRPPSCVDGVRPPPPALLLKEEDDEVVTLY